MSADILPIRAKSHEPVATPPRARVTIVDVVDRSPPEFAVGIDYESGEYILAGAFFDYAEALDVARRRAKALGVQAVDFTGIGHDDQDGAA